MSERDPDRPDLPGEPRAGDYLSGKVDEEELDPATQAQLAAWFGSPAATLPPPGPSAPRDPDVADLRQTRERAAAAVDPALLARLEAMTDAGDQLIDPPEAWRLPIERPLARFDPGVWRLQTADLREWDIPPLLYDDLEETTPQALLRDLHRPEFTWPLILRPIDLGMDLGGERARAQVSEAIARPYNVAMREITLASQEATRLIDELRAWLAEPWEDSYISDEERTERTSAMPSIDDYRWFGSIGYDPDL